MACERTSILIITGMGTPSLVAGLNFHRLIAARAFVSACRLSDDLTILGSCTRPSVPIVTENTAGPLPSLAAGAGLGVSMAFGGMIFTAGSGVRALFGDAEPFCEPAANTRQGIRRKIRTIHLILESYNCRASRRLKRERP